MARVTIDFSIRPYLVDCEAEGQPCFQCEDPVWFRASQIRCTLVIDGKESRRVMDTPFVLCASCSDGCTFSA